MRYYLDDMFSDNKFIVWNPKSILYAKSPIRVVSYVIPTEYWIQCFMEWRFEPLPATANENISTFMTYFFES